MKTPAVIQFEITAADGAALQHFYAGLFDWPIQQTGTPGYGRVPPTAGGIPGAIGPSWDGGVGHLTIYVEVDDLDATLAGAVELGGTLVGAPIAKPEANLRFAFVADPAGHVIALAQGLQAALGRFPWSTRARLA
jgi:predicted enzyme related to lactoylglutathione lyase